MRLWHKDLIPVLPRKQLLAQWRELCCIAKNISTKGTPNHLLVNKVLNYHVSHFIVYSDLILHEMRERNYRVSTQSYLNFSNNMNSIINKFNNESTPCLGYNDLFKGWHNDRYFNQCYSNLEEKYDCGGIPEDEWIKVYEM